MKEWAVASELVVLSEYCGDLCESLRLVSLRTEGQPQDDTHEPFDECEKLRSEVPSERFARKRCCAACEDRHLCTDDDCVTSQVALWE